jgi:hypothetical protein
LFQECGFRDIVVRIFFSERFVAGNIVLASTFSGDIVSGYII